MATITLSRQLGSLGDEVAHRVAQRLGYQVRYHELINQAAQRAGKPEMALAFLDVLGLLDLRPSAQDLLVYQRAMQEIMVEWANTGKVILIGRAGCVLLGGRPDVLHVRVIAPLDVRIERIAQKQGISLSAARTQVEASDRTRQAYLRRQYQSDWDDAQLYDLVLNSGRCSVEQAAQIIEVVHRQILEQSTTDLSLKQESDLE